MATNLVARDKLLADRINALRVADQLAHEAEELERQATEAAAEAKKAEDQKAIEAAQKALEPLEKTAILTIKSLLEQLADIEDQYRRMRVAGKTATHTINQAVMDACKLALTLIKHSKPELLGLAPKRTLQEERRLEAADALARAEKHLAELKEGRDKFGVDAVSGNMIDNAKRALELAKERFEALK